jgi:hypothetical protein
MILIDSEINIQQKNLLGFENLVSSQASNVFENIVFMATEMKQYDTFSLTRH